MCYLEEKLDREQTEYALGPAMMEPDFRILSNEKGYCSRHSKKLSEAQKALPLALVMDTRCGEAIKKLKEASPEEKRGGLFSKKESGYERIKNAAKELSSSCLICERVQHTLSQYCDTFWFLYDKEPDFKKRILAGKGFCLTHFAKLLERLDTLSSSRRERFASELFHLELSVLERQKEEVFAFTKQFDYRANKKEWQGERNAHIKCAERLSSGLFQEK